MSLTPVRVRGKRKAPSTQTPLALQNQPKRIKKPLSTVVASRAMRDTPTLESLPTEILESILLYSASTALPRASHLIGCKLSNRATQLRMFMLAFHGTWNQWFGISGRDRLPRPARRDPREEVCDGDYALQSELLTFSWVDIDFILQAQQTWANTHAADRWYSHHSIWMDRPEEVGHSHEGGYAHFDARACFEVDYQQALKTPAFAYCSEDPGSHDVHPRTRIPSSLITGPWGDEEMRRLFWLVRGGAISHNRVGGERGYAAPLPPWEDRLKCLRNAVLDAPEPNPLVAQCLMDDWLFQDLPWDIARTLVVDFQRRLDWGSNSPEARYILNGAKCGLLANLEMP